MNTYKSAKRLNESFWHALFAADSVAVIGAKDVVGSWGYDAMSVVLASAGEAGRQVYAVNPGTSEVLGLSTYASVLDIPGPVELAIVVVPAAVAPEVFRQCAQKKVKAAVVVSAGFAEADAEGAALEAELLKIATESGMHFVGPNCVGHADMHSPVASAGIARLIRAGTMSLLSQSGTLGSTVMQMVTERGLGISKFVSTGNEADLRLEDFLEYLAGDKNTRVIAAYIEGLREARRFFELHHVRKPEPCGQHVVDVFAVVDAPVQLRGAVFVVDAYQQRVLVRHFFF